MIINAIKDLISTVQGINKRYAKPALATSKAVKFSLLCLRLYLILLVGILFFKFYTTIAK